MVKCDLTEFKLTGLKTDKKEIYFYQLSIGRILREKTHRIDYAGNGNDAPPAANEVVVLTVKQILYYKYILKHLQSFTLQTAFPHQNFHFSFGCKDCQSD